MTRPIVYIGFTAAPGLLGSIIRWASHADVSHAFLAWDDINFGERMTIGANANGVTMQPLSRMALDTPTLWQGEFDLWPGIIKRIDLINAPYGYADLFEMGAVEAERHLMLRAGSDTVRQAGVICSEYVCDVMREAGYEVLPGIKAGFVDPGQLEHWVRTNGFDELGEVEI